MVSRVSSPKLENVVYPPSTPTTRNSRQFGRSVNNVVANPIRKQPDTLIANVPSGKLPPYLEVIAVPSTYRLSPPSAAPKITAR